MVHNAKMKIQEELLTAAQQAIDTASQTVNSGVDAVTGSELSRLQTVGSRENIAAENAVKTFLSEQKALTMEKTGEQKEDYNNLYKDFDTLLKIDDINDLDLSDFNGWDIDLA